MKPRLIPLALGCAALCSSLSAAAQSSVTLYGRIDVNYTRISGEGGWQMDQASTSRIGLRGSEDLGNGRSVIFQFESRVNPEDGSTETPRFWGREAWLGMRGGFGTVRMGRSLSPSQRVASQYDPHGTDGIGSFGSSRLLLGHPSATFVRFDSGLFYETPNWGGFTVFGAVSVRPRDATTGLSQRYRSIRLRYVGGGFDASLAYGKLTSGNDITSLGLAYDFGVIKPMAQLHVGKRADRKRATWLIGATAPLGGGKLRAAYSKLDDRGPAPAVDRTLLSIGYDWSLSKRTTLYGTLARDKTQGQGSKNGIELGVRHNF